ncbi:MAG: YggS family pyridoxal phosphate-dependent enzyme [Anaerolineaceae bacterium]|nr:YggS family pyridoxal phosphate-dependent enzyme [Anaerolineaceae bacterium]
MNNIDIKTNFSRVTDQIETYCNLYNRNKDSVKLVVVTKSHPWEKIENVISAGAQYLGENYPEETIEKKNRLHNLSDNIEWHMIGHLQSRKTQAVIDNFNFLHSLDSVKLALRLNRQLKEKGKFLDILLQFNVGGEESKFGWDASEKKNWVLFIDEVSQVLSCENLHVRGLMTMPPYTTEEKAARNTFNNLRELGEYLSEKLPLLSITDYSMGTSHDFKMAIAEGSTMIRIGEAIMGPRE